VRRLVALICAVATFHSTAGAKVFNLQADTFHFSNQTYFDYKVASDQEIRIARTLQKNLGLWWPSYWRIGNWRIVFPALRSSQARVARWLRNELDSGRIRAVYITRFKPINHCLVVYRCDRQPNGDLVFFVYDANQTKKIVHLTYRAADRSFYFDRAWYYKGGLVSVLALYVSVLF